MKDMSPANELYWVPGTKRLQASHPHDDPDQVLKVRPRDMQVGARGIRKG